MTVDPPAQDITTQKEAAHAELAHRLSMRSFRRKATVLVCSWVIMASVGLLWRRHQHHRAQVLHAVPETDLVSVDLTTNPQLFSALVSSTGKKVLYGKPSAPIEHPLDFIPAMNASNQTLATVGAPAPPAPAVTKVDKQDEPFRLWIQEAKLPPRPTNVTQAALSMAADAQDYAFEVMDARPGTVLVRSPDVDGEHDSLYKDAVILLLKVCGCHPSIFGVILTAPSNLTMDDEFCPVARRRYPRFVNNSIHLGGPVGPHWTVLADRPTVGSFAVAKDLHVVGSLADAHDKVARGEMAASAVSFFSGYAAWPISRLEQEVREGKWSVLKASTSLLRKRSGLLEALRARLQ